MQLSTHVVTLGTRSTNSSLSSSRAASAGETGSTSNTSSTLWGWRVWMWEHWMCRIQEEQTWSMRMTLTGEPLAPAEPSDPGAPCGQKDGNKTLTLIRSHSAFFYFSINLQANRKVQYLLTAGPAGPAGPGLPGSPRAPWGPSPPRAPWGPVSPCGGKQQSLRNLRLQYNKCLKETNHMCLNKEFRQRQSVRWRIRRATTQLAAFSFLLHSDLNKSRCVCVTFIIDPAPMATEVVLEVCWCHLVATLFTWRAHYQARYLYSKPRWGLRMQSVRHVC